MTQRMQKYMKMVFELYERKDMPFGLVKAPNVLKMLIEMFIYEICFTLSACTCIDAITSRPI